MTAGLLAVFLGVLLVDAAIRGVKPWSPLVEAFGGAPIVQQRTLDVDLTQVQGPSQGGGSVAGTPRVQAFAAAVAQAYPSLRVVGITSCRTIKPHGGGTSKVISEHAWSNAIDYAGDLQTMSKLVVWSNLNRNRFKINNVIGPGSAIAVVHVDFLPSHAGQPCPCAGGCSS